MVYGSERVFMNLATKTFYKQYGSTRALDRNTGNWDGKDDATEMIMFKVHDDVHTPYGVPRWINQAPSVIGSRSAEEFNLEFFDSGGLPPVLLLLQGASLDHATRDTMLKYLSGKAKDKQRGLLVEMFSNSGDINAATRSNVTVERFGNDRQSDAMFLKYDERAAMHVRAGFRLPSIYLGMSNDYNYATAMVSTMIAEAQVFRVEREQFDEIINTTIMKELNPDYLIKSRAITLNDVERQLKALDLAAKQTRVSRKALLGEIGRVANLTLDEDDEDDMPFIPPGAKQVMDPPNPEGAKTQQPNEM